MPEYLTITVTEEDVMYGKQYTAGKCPIALAMNRQYPVADGSWIVGPEMVLNSKDGGWIKLSRRAARWVKKFDSSGEYARSFVEWPVTFRLKKEEK